MGMVVVVCSSSMVVITLKAESRVLCNRNKTDSKICQSSQKRYIFK